LDRGTVQSFPGDPRRISQQQALIYEFGIAYRHRTECPVIGGQSRGFKQWRIGVDRRVKILSFTRSGDQRQQANPPRQKNGAPIKRYVVSERKLGIFSKIKEGENYNHRNTVSISRIII